MQYAIMYFHLKSSTLPCRNLGKILNIYIKRNKIIGLCNIFQFDLLNNNVITLKSLMLFRRSLNKID